MEDWKSTSIKTVSISTKRPSLPRSPQHCTQTAPSQAKVTQTFTNLTLFWFFLDISAMQLCNNSKIISTKNSSKLTHITLSAFIYVLVSINEVCHCLSVVWWKEFNLTRLLHTDCVTVDNNEDFASDGKNLATFHATSDKPSYIQMYQLIFVLSGLKCISLHVYYLVNATGPDVSQQLPAAQWVSSSGQTTHNQCYNFSVKKDKSSK